MPHNSPSSFSPLKMVGKNTPYLSNDPEYQHQQQNNSAIKSSDGGNWYENNSPSTNTTSTTSTNTTITTSTNNENEGEANTNNSNNNGNGNGGDDMQQEELRPLVLSIITTIRVKLDLLEADVERVNTLDELNAKKHYLNTLQEITRILSAFPRSDGYEAKELPESFSGKPRLIAFRNNMNFMLWENNSKLHLINDYVSSTDALSKLSLVFNVVNPIKTALDGVGDLSPLNAQIIFSDEPSPRLEGVGDTGPIVAHLNEFAERRWAERGRQVVRPARYSATTFAGSSRKFLEKMRRQVASTLDNMHSSGNLEEHFLSALDSPAPPAATRFTRSPSVSSIPVPKIKIPRREASNNLLTRFNISSFSPFLPDYSRPQAQGHPHQAPGPGSWGRSGIAGISRKQRSHPPVTPSIFTRSTPSSSGVHAPFADSEDSIETLRRSSSFQDNYSPSSSKIPSDPLAPPETPTSLRPESPSGFFRSASLSKDFAPSSLTSPSSTRPSPAYPASPSAYPASPPPSPPTSRSVPPLQSLRSEHSFSSTNSSSPPSSYRAEVDLDPVTADEDNDDPFDYKSVKHLPSFNVETPSTPLHPSTTSLPSRFSFALLSPVLPPHPHHVSSGSQPFPVFSRRAHRATIAVNEHTFRKGDPALDGDTAPLPYSKSSPFPNLSPPLPSPLACSTPVFTAPITTTTTTTTTSTSYDDLGASNGTTEAGEGPGPAFALRAKANTSPPPASSPSSSELPRTGSGLLRRSSSDSLRVPSNLRVRIPQSNATTSTTQDADVVPRVPSSSGSRLKFEAQEAQESRRELSASTGTWSPSSPTKRDKSEDSTSPSSPTAQPNRNRANQLRKRNISISFAFHALSRNLLGKSEREQLPPSSSAPRGKMEEAIMSRAASFKSDWLCPVVPTSSYRIDMGSTNVMELPTCMNIMDLDLDICYYHNEFVGKEHSNFLGTLRGINSMPGKPVGISMKFVKGSELTTAKFGEITALVRTVERDERVTVAFQPNLLASATPSRKRLVKLLQKSIPRLKDAQLEEIRDPKLDYDFQRFEIQQRVDKYKFGVLYCAEGQSEENDIYSNVSTSPDFVEFLRVLGDSVELEGWKHFRGGLDIKTNTTGTHSVYTKWNDYEIMFHVGPLLPYDLADEQRVERKRHIGNDIVVLIFKDGPSQINPAIFKSHFNHVFMVVQKDHAKSDVLPHYRVTFVCKEEVPVFGPMYPHSYSFPNTSKFREFIITKLVNAERSAMHSPVFFSKTKRTRQELLQGFINTYSTKK